jgi:hypothetical protein
MDYVQTIRSAQDDFIFIRVSEHNTIDFLVPLDSFFDADVEGFVGFLISPQFGRFREKELKRKLSTDIFDCKPMSVDLRDRIGTTLRLDDSRDETLPFLDLSLLYN